jgi:hypothetical protein
VALEWFHRCANARSDGYITGDLVPASAITSGFLSPDEAARGMHEAKASNAIANGKRHRKDMRLALDENTGLLATINEATPRYLFRK